MSFLVLRSKLLKSKLIVGREYQKGASPVSMSPKRERKDGESIFISHRAGGTPILKLRSQTSRNWHGPLHTKKISPPQWGHNTV